MPANVSFKRFLVQQEVCRPYIEYIAAVEKVEAWKNRNIVNLSVSPYLLHIEYQILLRTFWLVPTNTKDCLRVKMLF